MCRRVRTQCPLPANPVDAYRVHRQSTIGLDVQPEKMLEVLMVLGAVALCSMQAKTVGDPKVTRHPHHSSDATHQEEQAEESDQRPHPPKPEARRQPQAGNHHPGRARELQRRMDRPQQESTDAAGVVGETHHPHREHDHDRGKKKQRRTLPHRAKHVADAERDVTISKMQPQHQSQQHFDDAEHPGQGKVIGSEQPYPFPQSFRHCR